MITVTGQVFCVLLLNTDVIGWWLFPGPTVNPVDQMFFPGQFSTRYSRLFGKTVQEIGLQLVREITSVILLWISNFGSMLTQCLHINVESATQHIICDD